MNIALIVFGGKGERISSQVPKQFIKINGKDLVGYTIETFERHPLVDSIILVAPKDYVTYTKNLVLTSRFYKVANVVPGGANRQESVRNGLNALKAHDNDHILIHDGDRPLISDSLITLCLREIRKHNALIPVIRHEEALEEVSNSGRRYVKDNVIYDIQTPQCFKFKLIKDAHNKLKDEEFCDDASLIESLGGEVILVPGDKLNFKVTKDEDLEYLKTILEKKNA